MRAINKIIIINEKSGEKADAACPAQDMGLRGGLRELVGAVSGTMKYIPKTK